MRDIAVVSIVVVAALMALQRPWIGVMLWTWLSLMNPHRLSWTFAYEAPLAAIAAGATLVGLLITKERRSPFQGAPAVFLAALAVWVTLAWLRGFDTVGDYPQWSIVMKIYLMTMVALMLLHTKQQILAFAWVIAISLAYFGAKGGLFTIVTGGNHRVWGPPGSFIEDNNALALALIMTIPLLHFLKLQVTSALIRHGLSLVMLLCAASAIGSYSRGGLVAIAAMGAMFWWRGRQKAPMAILIGIAVLALLPMMPEDWWDRMRTIGEYESDASSQGRIYSWGVAWSVATHYFSGAGMSYQKPMLFLTYGTGADTVIAAHSIYFQILGNHGFVGLFLFVALWISTYWCAGRLRKHARPIPQAKWAADLGAMVQVSLLGYAAGGAFLSLSYFDLPYDMMVLVVLARKWVETRAWERESEMSFLESIGLRKPKRDVSVAAARAGVPARE